MKKNYWSLLRTASVFLLLLITLVANAQKRVVTGTITDSGGNPLPGVSVLIKGTTTGLATDADGSFSVEADVEDILVISFIGYTSQEIKVGNQTKFTVQMVEDVSTLQEVVVVGYGEMRKNDITAAQTSISAKDIGRTVNTTIEQAMQGRSAGVLVTQNTGAPGGGISVSIRGINSILGSNEPLYVVDGVQIQGTNSASGVNPLASLNPSDIQSLDILQGPNATAIYGSRGTNGVVLITTKRGKAGEMKVNYSLGYSVQAPPKELDVMNLSQYAQMENEYKAISGGEVREDFLDPSILGDGTNWQSELFKSAAMLKNMITLSGGSEKTTFYLSGERMTQDGTALGSGFNRSGARLNFDIKPRDWFYLATNINYTQTDEKLASNNVSGSNLIVNAIQLGPQVPVKNPDGTFGGGNISNSTAEQFSPVNPVALASVATNELERRKLIAGADAGFKVLDGLELKTSFSTTVEFSNQTYYLPTFKFGYQENTNAYLEKRDQLSTYWNWNQTIQYTKQLGKHHIYAMATHEAQKSTWENLLGTVSGFLTNEVLDLNAGNASTAGNQGGQNVWAMESYLGRLNYNFDNRYIVTGAFRTDGSAYFGSGKKWGYFPSVSAAWRLSEEDFFKVPSVSDLRFRYEIGWTGNQGSDGKAIYGTFAQAIATQWGSGFRPANYPNPDYYQWEETSTNNFGLTLGLFDGRIQLDLDYYVKNTDNLILPSELPWYMGTRGDAAIAPPTVNIGTLNNKGWGVSLTTTNIVRNGFKWETNFNVSGFKTEITSLSSGSSHITREGPDWFLANFAQRTQVGYAPWQFLGYIEEGLFQSKEEIENSARPVDNNGVPLVAAENSIWVGDVKYRDISGPDGVPDGKITEADRTLIGNPYPKLFGGITNSFSYKGFDVSILLTYSYGNKIYNYLRYQNANPNNINLGRNMFVETFDYAKVAVNDEGEAYLLNPETSINRISTSSVNGNYDRLTNKYLEDGSYLRVKNISINYNIPSMLIAKQKIVKGIRVGVSVQNIYTFTKYTGYDPEVGSYVGPNGDVAQGFKGVDYGRYPITPIYSFNLGVDF